MRYLLLICSMLFFVAELPAQEDVLIEKEFSTTVKKGAWSFVWGWNRAWFGNSDMHFEGNGYDFSLYDVKATDRQTPFSLDPYFHPLLVTIPQTNMRLAYNISDLWTLSFNVDHMKYVMVQDQSVKIDGAIDGHGNYDGVYNNEDVYLGNGLLAFEHTDGLNYLNFELSRFFPIWRSAHPRWGQFQLYGTTGIGAGPVMPKTNARVLDIDRYDEYHISGYGIGAKGGLHLAYKRFYCQSEWKAGFINLPDIRTSSNTEDRASQHFTYVQYNILFGVSFGFKNRH